jgi:hypothetical protein
MIFTQRSLQKKLAVGCTVFRKASFGISYDTTEYRLEKMYREPAQCAHATGENTIKSKQSYALIIFV